MNPFEQIDCMVESNLLTSYKGNQIKQLMAGLPSTDNGLLLFIAATTLLNSGSGGGGGFDPLYKTANYSALDGDDIIADTTAGSFTITLPADPVIGYRIDIFDAQSTFATNNLTVARNGQLIDGAASNLVMNLDNVHAALIFNGGAQGWSVYNL